MKKIYKISLASILLFGFAKKVFACSGGFNYPIGSLEFYIIFIFPLILILPLALIIFFTIFKNKQRKNILYFYIAILLLILYGCMAYAASYMASILSCAAPF
ncbi:MAG TPA: hypothetical protein P5323_02035 [Candidatus Moranbacteria bacterium]|nr:hypothetical protein [Candidatus Moranbacteria bacterium]HRY27895.1 hypothetical protein [Candidatus Moranbacteria bacterium]HSA08366.1 hypothetical protein [Candidatus Moranbacteria bacterium]